MSDETPSQPDTPQPVATQPGAVPQQAPPQPYPPQSFPPMPQGYYPPMPGSLEPWLAEILNSVRQQQQMMAYGFQTLQGETQMILDRLKELAGDYIPAMRSAPAPRVETVAAPRTDTNWDQVIFGRELSQDPMLSHDRHNMVQGLMSEEHAAMNLVGTLLVFRSSLPERMPPLLKDVGEAYYRWRPNASTIQDPFRDALIRWLEQACQQAGVANTIELVTPGDRFDAAKHHAKDKGIEVADVFGWVVLRDNGKVYTKATVTVK